MASLAMGDFEIVIVSNQSAIGRRLGERKPIERIHLRMGEVVRAGGRLDPVLYSPHQPDDSCQCRKPRPGLLHEAARDRGLD